MLFIILFIKLRREKDNINKNSNINNSHIKEPMLSATIFLKVVVSKRIRQGIKVLLFNVFLFRNLLK